MDMTDEIIESAKKIQKAFALAPEIDCQALFSLAIEIKKLEIQDAFRGVAKQRRDEFMSSLMKRES